MTEEKNITTGRNSMCESTESCNCPKWSRNYRPVGEWSMTHEELSRGPPQRIIYPHQELGMMSYN